MKPTVNILDVLCFEPQKGYRAIIQKNDGETLYTSQVVDVRRKTENGLEIETKNTLYRVTFSEGSLPMAG